MYSYTHTNTYTHAPGVGPPDTWVPSSAQGIACVKHIDVWDIFVCGGYD